MMDYEAFFEEVREKNIEVSFDNREKVHTARLSNEALFHLPLLAITILMAISGFRKGCKCLMCLYYEASRSFGLYTFLGIDVQRIIHRYVPA